MAKYNIAGKEAMSQTLTVLAKSHRGKFSDKWSSYLSAYDRILAEYKHRSIRLLEIGVQNGGSLELWARYFPNATHLVGCDINPTCAELKFDDPRIGLVIGDANTDAVQAEILGRCDRFDVIIDDGSHTSPDIVKSFARYFGALATGGVFIIEDLHCSYWQEFDGGLHLPTSSMAFLKQLADVINHEHWGVPTTRAAFLDGFATRYGIVLNESLLKRIHSIEFMNSACVIRKAEPAATRLGTRHIAGADGLVFDGVAGLTGSVSAPPDQSMNVWSAPPQPIPEATAAGPVSQSPVPAQPVIELFLDSGEGFAATNCLSQPIEPPAGAAEFTFDLSGRPELVALRLDPLTDSVVLEIEQVRLTTDTGEVDLIALVATNGRIANGNVYYFDSGDPQIYFTGIGPDQLRGALALRCRIRYLHVGCDAVQIALHELAAHQALKDATYRAAIASLQESVQAFQARQPAFDQGLAAFERTLEQIRHDHGAALARESAAQDLLRAQHSEAVSALMQDSSRQAAEYALSIQALQQAHDLAATQAERNANLRLKEASDAIARTGAERLAEQSALLERISHLEQTLATVQGWRGYRLLAKLHRPPPPF